MKKRMDIADAFFLVNESRETPMHVGGVSLYTLPKGRNEAEYLHELADLLRNDTNLRHPFGSVLSMGPAGALGPVSWVDDKLIDMEYHVRHSALPRPGRYRELFALVSRLHGTLLDRSRPLWELHLIEGLQDRQFAIYLKVHHCAMDGAAAMHLINSMHSTSQRSRLKYSPFSVEAGDAYRAQLGVPKSKPAKPQQRDIKAVTEILRKQLGGGVKVSKALLEYAGVWVSRGKSKLAVPFYRTPKSSLSGRITGARRFVAQSWSFERVRGVGRAMDLTLNDTVLAMCAGALRRYLRELGELPKQSLKAQVPVSLRAEDDLDSANAIGFLMADLATNEADPQKRMQIIKDSMDAAKNQLKGLSRSEIDLYNAITQVPIVVASLTGLATRIPAFNLVVSNVPGPRKPMYWNGARLDGLYPVNIPFHGFALSITLVSNDKNLDFGITACRHSMPHAQRLIDHLEEALQELEQLAELSAGAAGGTTKTKAKRKKAARKKKSASS
jgi:diacylglycerol O-acyltransferase